MIKGYKGFNKNLKCRNFQYEIGKEYQKKGGIKVCSNGFHFCEEPFDVFSYYHPCDMGYECRYCEVEGSGDIDRGDDDSKIACSKIKIKAEIGLDGIIKAGLNFILERINRNDNSVVASDRGQSVAASVGDQSAAINTGELSTAASVGHRSIASSGGYRSVAASDGDYSMATSAGHRSIASSGGYRSVAASVGDCSMATSAGHRSIASSAGHQSMAASVGDQSAAISTGDRSIATAAGKDSVAIATGCKSRAKGSIDSWIVLAERGDRDGDTFPILDIKAFKVDGELIKANTFYELIKGKPVEVK